MSRTREIPLKQWFFIEARRAGISWRGVESRLRLGKYPRLRLRRVNRRVIFVLR